MANHITPFAISGLLAGIFATAFGLFVFLKSRDRKLGLVWLLFALSTAGWGFGGFEIGLAQSDSNKMFWYCVAYSFGVVWIAPLFYHFTKIFLNLEEKVIKVHYLCAFSFCLLIWTKLFFRAPWTQVNDFYAPRGVTPFFEIFFSWWMGLIIYSHFLLLRAFRNVSANKRQQIKYFFLATSIGYTGGSLCYLPMFGIRIYPWGNFAVFLYPIIMAYAMLKYQLMDVRVFLRRAALLIGVYIGLLIVGLPLMAFIHSIAITPPLVSKTWLSVEVTIMAVLLSCGPFLYAYVVRSRSYFKEHTMAGLTHELKSPLATMENALEIFGQRIAKRLEPDDIAYLSMLKKNQQRLSNSINNLLEVYKVNGESSIRSSDIDLNDLLRQTSVQWEALAKNKGIIIVHEFPGLPITIQGDRKKLEQAFGNILSNAVKFSEQGVISIKLISKQNQIDVSVKDSGVGISAQHLPYVFDRFFQGNVKRSAQGTGIGLTIAKTWIEAHGGRIWAESEGEGRGTTVTFTLPV
jgi:signal transduction histidine kinase